MCSLRRMAIAAPIIASQRKSIDASSSDQIRGVRNTYRATIPENKITTSASTRPAATYSKNVPTPRSIITSHCLPPLGGWRQAIAMASGQAILSGQLAGIFFEQRPGLVAELLLPFSIEARFRQHVAERRNLRFVENHPLADQFGPRVRIELLNVCALCNGRRIDVLRKDLAQVIRQPLPGRTAQDSPLTGPQMICDRTVLLNFKELYRQNQRQWIFLTIDDAGLQGGIQLVEVDAGRRRSQRLEH